MTEYMNQISLYRAAEKAKIEHCLTSYIHSFINTGVTTDTIFEYNRLDEYLNQFTFDDTSVVKDMCGVFHTHPFTTTVNHKFYVVHLLEAIFSLYNGSVGDLAARMTPINDMSLELVDPTSLRRHRSVEKSKIEVCLRWFINISKKPSYNVIFKQSETNDYMNRFTTSFIPKYLPPPFYSKGYPYHIDISLPEGEIGPLDRSLSDGSLPFFYLTDEPGDEPVVFWTNDVNVMYNELGDEPVVFRKNDINVMYNLTLMIGEHL
jgi:hypothetical protein